MSILLISLIAEVIWNVTSEMDGGFTVMMILRSHFKSHLKSLTFRLALTFPTRLVTL